MVSYAQLQSGRLPYWVGAGGLLCLVLGVVGLLGGGRAPAAVAGTGPAVEALAYYPLEVGRFWVYQHLSQEAVGQTKRRIVRRQQGPEEELFFFEDGTIARFADAKVYEMGPNGGVNVIPLAHSAKPYVYTTQGLRIEKWVGEVGTQVEVNGRSYGDCLEVVTRFHRQGETAGAAFSSYYARGIGMVGRGPWPRQAGAPLVVALRDYGIERL